MKFRMFGMLIAALGVFATALAPNEAFAGSRAVFAPKHHQFAHGFRHHHQGPTVVVPDEYGIPYEAMLDTVMEGAPPATGRGAMSYTQVDEVPWDWAHRYPTADRTHAPGCQAETVTVPNGHGGTGQVNITRCY
jgi:hypothetical protein